MQFLNSPKLHLIYQAKKKILVIVPTNWFKLNNCNECISEITYLEEEYFDSFSLLNTAPFWLTGNWDKKTNIYIRPLHYPEDHSGVQPKELSIFVGPKFQNSAIKIEAVRSLSCSAWEPPNLDNCLYSADGSCLWPQTTSILVLFFRNFRFRVFKYQYTMGHQNNCYILTLKIFCLHVFYKAFLPENLLLNVCTAK